jgi:hypothetical protein
VREALQLLLHPGCPACRFCDHKDAKFFDWFEIEKYGQQPMVKAMRASLGMCPAHTRQLVTNRSSWLLTTVYGYVVSAAVSRTDWTRATCPACADARWALQHVLGLIVPQIREPAVRKAYAQTGGFCLPHALAAIRSASIEEAVVIARTLLGQLEGAAVDDGVALVAGSDTDSALRHVHRQPVLETAEPGASTLGALADRLAGEACPICNHACQTEHRYLEWLLSESLRHDTDGPAEARGLCPSHVHDLTCLSVDAGIKAVGLQAASAAAGIRRLLEEVEGLPPCDPVGRLQLAARAFGAPGSASKRPRRALAVGLASRKQSYAAAREIFVRRQPCPVCQVVVETERRSGDLLRIALLDADVSDRYRRCHGVCVHHAATIAGLAESAPVRERLHARLSLLGWELDEGVRKSAWQWRFEPPGPEADAWRRAITQLDGRAFLGSAGTRGGASEDT